MSENYIGLSKNFCGRLGIGLRRFGAAGDTVTGPSILLSTQEGANGVVGAAGVRPFPLASGRASPGSRNWRQ
ncbi:unnamed protein product [Cylicostephanus goldi]|uniref:Uncharacterized protein n=1 Tax=Cylicostephanus goldi TaxID=71465 RepID=A0A3P7NG21_CYLGO|nr:unnamed protein product [Cylicostephanus goldi]